MRGVSNSLFSALERGSLTWDNWEGLMVWWEQMLEGVKLRASRPGLKRPQAAVPPVPAAGGPSAPKQPRSAKLVYGIEGSYLKSNHICIKWNLGSCQIQHSPHDSPERSDSQQVRHVCGGCLFQSRGEDSSHSMKTCRYKKDGLFV